MPTYRAIVNGRNFLLEIDGKQQRFGFFQTVIVAAATPAQAELDAISTVKASPDLQQLVKNDRADPPMLHLDTLHEVEAAEAGGPSSEGRSLYREDA